MIAEEIAEVKKRFKKTDCSIGRITGCYVVGADKEIRTYIDESFLNLDDEEQFKYLELMKKGLSGTLGKNLLNLDFTKEAEEVGGQQKILLGLRESELKNKEFLDTYYKQIIDNFDYAGNYVILLIHDTYDVMKKTSDKLELDESEEVYEYIMCCICPVNLSKPGLSYHEEENKIANRERDWVVEMPEAAFLFPAFNDRSSDIHSLLYYVKNTDDLHLEFIDEVLGCEAKLPSDRQKAVFQDIIADIINTQQEYDTFEVVRAVNDTLTEMIEDNPVPEPIQLDSEGIKEVLKQSGVKEEHLDKVSHAYEDAVGNDTKLDADSIVEKKKLQLKTADYTVQVKNDSSDLIEIRIIDGRKCLVIPMDADIEVNGILKKLNS